MKSLLSLCVALLALACGPLVMIPGGELSGATKPVPSDWLFTDAVETVQLETRPEDPYSVNVWGVSAAGAFYIASADPENQWAQNIAADERVRLRVGEDLFELKAKRTDDPADLEAFLAAAKQKYDFEPEPEQRGKAILFRLEPRT